ncbi:reverse transcriptase domain-containing protein, partial [Enterobacter hormaechei]|uniref:reverse transcriptase domain-containing protein n=1 Tax=Enterobacter hormaechei TaxID=158836 RepID=UPI0023E4097A
HLEKLDGKTTFLYGDLHKEIHMAHAQGFEVKGKENLVCRLQKSLYGLKQEPHQWYVRFDNFMHEHGYSRFHLDRSTRYETIALFLYVFPSSH